MLSIYIISKWSTKSLSYLTRANAENINLTLLKRAANQHKPVWWKQISEKKKACDFICLFFIPVEYLSRGNHGYIISSHLKLRGSDTMATKSNAQAKSYYNACWISLKRRDYSQNLRKTSESVGNKTCKVSSLVRIMHSQRHFTHLKTDGWTRTLTDFDVLELQTRFCSYHRYLQWR